MAIGDPYATLDELKDYLKIPLTKTSLDAALANALASASEEIERHCNRQFNKTTTASPRVFIPHTPTMVDCDDFHTIQDLVIKIDGSGDGTFETTVTAYELYPLNGVIEGQGGWPTDHVRVLNGLRFPIHHPSARKATCQITAQWGWPSVPAPVKQACLIMAAETFQLKDAPFGVAGMDDFGTVRVHENKLAALKLAKYRRYRVMVG